MQIEKLAAKVAEVVLSEALTDVVFQETRRAQYEAAGASLAGLSDSFTLEGVPVPLAEARQRLSGMLTALRADPAKHAIGLLDGVRGLLGTFGIAL